MKITYIFVAPHMSAPFYAVSGKFRIWYAVAASATVVVEMEIHNNDTFDRKIYCLIKLDDILLNLS